MTGILIINIYILVKLLSLTINKVWTLYVENRTEAVLSRKRAWGADARVTATCIGIHLILFSDFLYTKRYYKCAHPVTVWFILWLNTFTTTNNNEEDN